MDGTSDNIIVNSCDLTPIYLIQESGVAQATSYVFAPASQVEQKPVSNLKRFYESSGNLEKSVLLNNTETTKPKILKKSENGQIGNNLKLASFLVPKTCTVNKPVISPPVYTTVNNVVPPVNNIVYKPTVATVATPSANVPLNINTVPKIDIDRKIVKLKPSDAASRHYQRRSVPKKKPKEFIPETPKYTSVQLLKLGETYHSLNVLSDDQIKIVNQALNIIKDPEKIPQEPTYDPITNTRFIYKIVSPKDLKVVGKNKIAIKERREEHKKGVRKVEMLQPYDEQSRIPLEAVVTRSGRKVKLPKQMLLEDDSPQKPRKRNGSVVTCLQCSAEFGSLYQLQKHYESNPTHVPAKVHSNLFHCLLAIVKSGSEEDRTRMFIQQLEQFVHKLKSLLPCLLNKIDGSEKLCNIGDEVGRLFGMSPGKYNLNIEALDCVKDNDGNCKHNPPPPKPQPHPVSQFTTELGKPSQIWLSKHNEEIATIDMENNDCARINAVDKWPTVNNKLRNMKQKSQKNHIKKMRLTSDNNELIELGKEDLISLTTNDNCAINSPQTKMVSLLTNDNGTDNESKLDNDKKNTVEDPKQKLKHIQFHSTHFDIRSSPIKPSSSTVFRKFQINPEKIEKFNVQIIRPLDLDILPKTDLTHEMTSAAECKKMVSIFRDEIDMTCKDVVINNELDFDNSKNWTLPSASNGEQTDENYIQSNSLIEPSLIHVKDITLDRIPYDENKQTENMATNDDHDNQETELSLSQGQSVLNFLETLGNELTYPEPEIRNSAVDFHLDLFSFNNS